MQLSSPILPDLRILPTASLIPHEDDDPRRAMTLGRRLLGEGLLKHPPVVAPLPDDNRFVILDGANRVQVFMGLSIPHIVAQVVSYSDAGVMLESWNHIVSGVSQDLFEDALARLDGLRLQICTLAEARLALAAEQALAYVVCENGVRKILPAKSGRREVRRLNDLVSVYRSQADVFLASNDLWERQKSYYPHMTALVVFPSLRPADILHAAARGYRIPCGITRHIVPSRALNINFPLGVLMADWSYERKQAYLAEWLNERISADSIRYYAESSFSFNE